MSIHVLIAGGGIGGLALAQALRKAGVGYAVYERDPEPDHRPQGYRIHIDATGHTALHECLPEHLYQLYLATSTRTPAAQQAMFFDHRFTRTGAGDARVSATEQDSPPTAVNRRTLREVLLAELGSTLHFGREVTRVEQPGSGVRVHFTDGATATGD
ncbi:MAG: FAD-dependent monooxygenase, partial [Actinobacteria bacterium]|nr:FAD-dependent monooxygenase [Actinomycetota bacterium]